MVLRATARPVAAAQQGRTVLQLGLELQSARLKERQFPRVVVHARSIAERMLSAIKELRYLWVAGNALRNEILRENNPRRDPRLV